MLTALRTWYGNRRIDRAIRRMTRAWLAEDLERIASAESRLRLHNRVRTRTDELKREIDAWLRLPQQNHSESSEDR